MGTNCPLVVGSTQYGHDGLTFPVYCGLQGNCSIILGCVSTELLYDPEHLSIQLRLLASEPSLNFVQNWHVSFTKTKRVHNRRHRPNVRSL